MRTVRRAWVMFALGLLCGLAALVTGRDLYYHLAYLCAITLLLSALWAWSATQGLRLSRYTRTSRAQVGRPLEERFSLRNTSWLPKLWVVVRDDSDMPNHHASRVIHNLKQRQEHSWTVRTLCERRGRFRLGPVVISSSDPLGLFEFQRLRRAASWFTLRPCPCAVSLNPRAPCRGEMRCAVAPTTSRPMPLVCVNTSLATVSTASTGPPRPAGAGSS